MRDVELDGSSDQSRRARASGTTVNPSQTTTAIAERDAPMQRMLRRLRVAERAHRAPRAVIEMQAEEEHRDDVEQRDPPDAEARDDVAVDVAVAVASRSCRASRRDRRAPS